MCGRRQMAGSLQGNARFAAMMATFDLQWHRFIPSITVDEWMEVEMELDQDPSVHNVNLNDDLHQATNAGRKSESGVTCMYILDQDVLDVGLYAARASGRGNDDTCPAGTRRLNNVYLQRLKDVEKTSHALVEKTSI